MTSIGQATGLVLLSTSLTFSIRSPIFRQKRRIFFLNATVIFFMLLWILVNPFLFKYKWAFWNKYLWLYYWQSRANWYLEKSKANNYCDKRYCKCCVPYAKQLKQFDFLHRTNDSCYYRIKIQSIIIIIIIILDYRRVVWLLPSRALCKQWYFSISFEMANCWEMCYHIQKSTTWYDFVLTKIH